MKPPGAWRAVAALTLAALLALAIAASGHGKLGAIVYVVANAAALCWVGWKMRP